MIAPTLRTDVKASFLSRDGLFLFLGSTGSTVDPFAQLKPHLVMIDAWIRSMVGVATF